ncbi:MAG TPA: MerR family transcriptional regulator [Geomonas sp.]|nr:MerR family transcriptional regulator [Geomonas sp.]
MYRITELARQFGLSRSTLLYYDRIGLLSPSGRSESGYRQYSRRDRDRLASICSFRDTGLTIEDIRRVLSVTEDEDASGLVLRKRLQEIGEEIRTLQSQQHIIARMLKVQALGELPVDKRAWVEMLSAAGMDEAAMMKWHAEFETRAPEAHHQFLRSLGLPEEEALLIRSRSKGAREEEADVGPQGKGDSRNSRERS